VIGEPRAVAVPHRRAGEHEHPAQAEGGQQPHDPTRVPTQRLGGDHPDERGDRHRPHEPPQRPPEPGLRVDELRQPRGEQQRDQERDGRRPATGPQCREQQRRGDRRSHRDEREHARPHRGEDEHLGRELRRLPARGLAPVGDQGDGHGSRRVRARGREGGGGLPRRACGQRCQAAGRHDRYEERRRRREPDRGGARGAQEHEGARPRAAGVLV